MAITESTSSRRSASGRNIEHLESKPLDRTSQSAFGQSYRGGQLGHHTSIAERHVVEAINELVVGLDGFRESVERAYQHIEETDGGVGGSLTSITVQIDENRFNEAAPCVGPHRAHRRARRDHHRAAGPGRS